MALASRLAGRDNAVPSLQGSDSWLIKKKHKKNPELVPARLGAVKLHFRCCRNILDLVVNKHASIDSTVACWARHVGLRALTLFDCGVTCAIHSRSLYATSQAATCDSDVMDRGAGLAPSNSSLTLFEKVTVQPIPKVKWLLRGSKNRFDRLTW